MRRYAATVIVCLMVIAGMAAYGHPSVSYAEAGDEKEGIETPDTTTDDTTNDNDAAAGNNKGAENSKADVTTTHGFLSIVNNTCPNCVKVVTDYYYVSSCREKNVDAVDMKTVEGFMESDPRFVYLLGLISLTPPSYVDLLETYYKAHCLYQHGMKVLDQPLFSSDTKN